MDQNATNSKEKSDEDQLLGLHETQTKANNYDISDTSQDNKTRKLDHGVVLSHETSTNTIKLLGSSKETENEPTFERSKEPVIFEKHSLYCQSPTIVPALQISSLQSVLSVNIPLPIQPQSLFLLALSKLNESSLSLVMSRSNILQFSSFTQNAGSTNYVQPYSPELTPPGSLTSAPPSYSFVLRQMAVRRRPRWMGTFIPSPSFVQHTPPPNYATAFDIYVDNPIQPPTTRIYHFGFTPIPIVCPECGFAGMTRIKSKITLCTHLSALVLCLLCCWLCAPLPYMLRSCKDVYHYCTNCRYFLGMYCPTNPENTYS